MWISAVHNIASCSSWNRYQTMSAESCIRIFVVTELFRRCLGMIIFVESYNRTIFENHISCLFCDWKSVRGILVGIKRLAKKPFPPESSFFAKDLHGFLHVLLLIQSLLLNIAGTNNLTSPLGNKSIFPEDIPGIKFVCNQQTNRYLRAQLCLVANL